MHGLVNSKRSMVLAAAVGGVFVFLGDGARAASITAQGNGAFFGSPTFATPGATEVADYEYTPQNGSATNQTSASYDSGTGASDSIGEAFTINSPVDLTDFELNLTSAAGNSSGQANFIVTFGSVNVSTGVFSTISSETASTAGTALVHDNQTANTFEDFSLSNPIPVTASAPGTEYAFVISENQPLDASQLTTGGYGAQTRYNSSSLSFAGANTTVPGTEQVDNGTGVAGTVLTYEVGGTTYTGVVSSSIWNSAGSGDWNNAANWNNNTVPNENVSLNDDEADFFGSITGNRNVYTDTVVAITTINFNNAHTYVIDGAGSLVLQAANSTNPQVIVQQGKQEINLPTTLANNTTFNVAANSTLNIADPITINSGVTLTQTGSGTVLYTSVVNVQSNASIDIADSTHASTLNLATNATAIVAAPVLEVDNLSNLGTVNLKNNEMIINYGSGADPISSIVAEIKSGYAGGAWTGAGITSTNAQSNSSYGIGYADAADPNNPAGLASGQIEIMYTLLGDANLDHKVNGDDFTLLATNFNDSVTNGWDKGDFNYSGTVNGDDFVLLADNFNQFASQSSVGAADLAALNSFAVANGISLNNASSVPEPASLGLLTFGAFGLLARTRRRRGNG
jgi:PEP-CTERM motif